ncbi:MAG: hypothetical protein NC124_16260 [Clostridium sp.]|nr:hypothetical protein [Clostridium sp.]
MNNFDKMIKELSKNVDIPEGFSDRVETVLESLPEDDDGEGRQRTPHNRRRLGFAACIICVVCVLAFNSMQAEANIFETFKQTIMDFLNLGTDPETGESKGEELGIESSSTEIESKRDLMLELREVVVDAQGIYLLVKITAPPDITLTEDITFDYFAFCEGENYNADHIIGGGTQCRLLETMEEKPNVATYTVTISSDIRPYLDNTVVACFKDLTLDPYGENPELLVEGMWSIPFWAEITVRDSIEIEGSDDITFPFVGATATVERIDLTPLGITLLSDVSRVPYDELCVSDTTITLRLKMMDGSEIYIMPHNPEQEWIVDSGNVEYSDEGGKTYQKDSYSFTTAIELSKVVGVYVQEVYVPVE